VQGNTNTSTRSASRHGLTGEEKQRMPETQVTDVTALLHGLDLQSIGLAAPGIIATLHVPPRSFGLVFSAALLGLMPGAFGLGPIADRIGRRRILIGALLIIGAFTVATAYATSFQMLLALRFLAGIGLGGAMPSFISLGSEYAPWRLRAVLVGMLWAGFPLGGVLGGILGARLIPAFGWQSLFYVGGVLPVLLAIVLIQALPESIGFLVASGAPPVRIATLLARITGHTPPPGTRFVLGEQRVPGLPLRQLFTQGRGPGTVLLWIAYFTIFLLLVTNTAWSPILLHAGGMPVPQAAIAVAAFNAGSSGLIAMTAIFHPTAMRSTGVGWAMGMGRFGSFTGPLLVGLMVGAGWGITTTYGAVGAPALVAAVCTAILGWCHGRIGASRAAPVHTR